MPRAFGNYPSARPTRERTIRDARTTRNRITARAANGVRPVYSKATCFKKGRILNAQHFFITLASTLDRVERDRLAGDCVDVAAGASVGGRRARAIPRQEHCRVAGRYNGSAKLEQ